MFFFTKNNKSDSIIDRPILGRTLPSLLDEACDSYLNDRAFNHWQTDGWQSQSNRQLRVTAEQIALGLSQEQLKRGDKVALLMHSDVNFCLADFATLLAGFVNVPIDLTQTLDNIIFILRHCAARVLIVADIDLLAQLIPHLEKISHLQTIIVADTPEDWESKRSQLLSCGLDELGIGNSELDVDNNSELSSSACLCLPMLLCQARQDLNCPELPECIQLFSLEEVRARGQNLWSEEKVRQLRSSISARDLATIIYIAGNTGQPKGVMLTHENITADILTAFGSIPELQPGERETVMSFLPLTHVFARAFIYGHLNYGHSIYFSNPNRIARDFLKVKPTLVATVPRMLEKIYQKIIDRGDRLKGINKVIFNWALKLAQNYELGSSIGLFDTLQLKLADKLVFARIRQPFGGQLKYFISGGAGLKAEIANTLTAVGITVLQGYGLTETSSVICCNQATSNRAGTVGRPIPGVQIKIAVDREILVKAPYIMQGYYQNPEATRAVIDSEGWLHTGDLGEFTGEGFLTITGTKKDIFKLSTGKYVTPQPLEDYVQQSPLVDRVVVVGKQKKFCGMLIFPDLDKLQEYAKTLTTYSLTKDLLQHPQILTLYQTLVDEANAKLPRWSQVKRFGLVNSKLSLSNGLLDTHAEVNRARVEEVFASEINALYGEEPVSSSQLKVRNSELAWSSQLQLLGKKLRFPRSIVLPRFKSFIGCWRDKSMDLWRKMPIFRRNDRYSQLSSHAEEQVSNYKLQTPNSELETTN